MADNENHSLEEGTWRDIFTFENRESVVLAVIRALNSNGVDTTSVQTLEKQPKDGKKTKSKLYGKLLTDEEQQRALYKCGERPYYLPRAFVEPLDVLKKLPPSEGLFRKNGSVVRQRSVRAAFESGASLPSSLNSHDASALLKQFLRELPNPLLTRQLASTFRSCVQQETNEKRRWCVLVTTLLLPTQHLLCAQALMRLLKQVTDHSEHSKMDANSLAVVMAPNLFPPSSTSSSSRQILADPSELKQHTDIVRILINHAHLIGCAPQSIADGVHAITSECTASMSKKPSKGRGRKHRKRDSISGILINKFNKWRGRDEFTLATSPTGLDDSASSIPLLKDPEPINESLEPTCSKRPALMTAKASSKTHTDTPVPLKRKKGQQKRPIISQPLLLYPPASPSVASLLMPKKTAALPCTPLVTSTPLHLQQTRDRHCLETLALAESKPLTLPISPTAGQQMNENTESTQNDCITKKIDFDKSTDNFLGPTPLKVRRQSTHKTDCCQEGSSDSLVDNIVTSKQAHSNEEETIANRVRKRRESQREQALPQSFSVDCFPATPGPSLTFSRSDACLSQHATPFSCTRPLLKATKRKGRVSTGATGLDKSWREKPVCASSPTRTVQTKGISPGLLHQFSNELADRYRYTPSQLAPISNNDSYVCAMTSDKLPEKDQEKKEEQQCSSWMVIDTPSQQQPVVHHQQEDTGTLSVNKVLRSVNNLATPASTKRRQKLPNLLTPSSWHKAGAGTKASSARAGNLTRRAKQYMIDDKQAETLAQTLPSRVNKRGIKVSEWVL